MSYLSSVGRFSAVPHWPVLSVPQGLAPEDACSADMLVLIRWHGRTMAVPLSQLIAIDVDDCTAWAIGDWHYWVAQGYCL